MDKTQYKVVSIHGAPRSGTSWLGEIFNSHPNVAYRFQPFFAPRYRGRINGSSNREDLEAFFEELYDLKDDDFILHRSGLKDAARFPSIRRYASGLKWIPGAKSALALARRAFRRPCAAETTFAKVQNPGFLVMKEVRYHNLIEKMLREVKGINVIGIVRNPCAVINSWFRAPREFNAQWDLQQEWRRAEQKNQGRESEYHGFEKWKELAGAFLKFEQEFPKAFTLVQYESLVESPLPEIERLFSFVGLTLDDQVQRFIRESQNNHDSHEYSVFKSPTVKDTWRTQLSPAIAEEIMDELDGTALERFLK